MTSLDLLQEPGANGLPLHVEHSAHGLREAAATFAAGTEAAEAALGLQHLLDELVREELLALEGRNALLRDEGQQVLTARYTVGGVLVPVGLALVEEGALVAVQTQGRDLAKLDLAPLLRTHEHLRDGERAPQARQDAAVLGTRRRPCCLGAARQTVPDQCGKEELADLAVGVERAAVLAALARSELGGQRQLGRAPLELGGGELGRVGLDLSSIHRPHPGGQGRVVDAVAVALEKERQEVLPVPVDGNEVDQAHNHRGVALVEHREQLVEELALALAAAAPARVKGKDKEVFDAALVARIPRLGDDVARERADARLVETAHRLVKQREERVAEARGGELGVAVLAAGAGGLPRGGVGVSQSHCWGGHACVRRERATRAFLQVLFRQR